MRVFSQRFLSSLLKALPPGTLLRIQNRAAIFVSKKPELLSNRAVRFLLFDVLKVELASAPVSTADQQN